MDMKGHYSRFLAISLVCVILINMILSLNISNALAENNMDNTNENNIVSTDSIESLDNFTFFVKDKNDLPIEGAYVSYSSVSGSAIVAYSNSLGAANFDISSLSDEAINQGINSYTVKKFKYEDVSVITGAAISFYQGSHTVTMYELPLVTFSGKVSSNGKSVVGADISLEGYDSYSTVSNEDGFYHISNVYGTSYGEGKDYILSVNHPDYKPYSTNVTFYDSNVTMDISLTEKLEQENFRFLNPDPGTVDIISNNGVTYLNPVEGGSGEGAIKYQIVGQAVNGETTDSDIATIDPETGMVTFLKPGTIVVKATKEADSVYKSAEATYQITFQKAIITDFSFDDPNPVNINTKTKFINKATSNSYHGDEPITYSIIKGNEVAEVDSETGELFIKTAGKVVVQARIAESIFYNEVIATYNLTIEKTKPGNLKFENQSPNPQPFNIPLSNKVINVKGTGKISYTSSDIEIAEVDKNGLVTAKKPGTVTITALVEGDSIYDSATGSYMIKFTKAPQDEFTFENETYEIVFGEEYHASVIGGKGNGSIYYDTDNKDVAFFEDPYQDKLTVRKAGKVTIYATISGDDYYESKKISKQLIIHKGNQTIKFTKDGSNFHINYGETFSNLAEGGEGKGAITYSIVLGNDIASIDQNTGVLSFKNKKVGTIKIKAYKAADECYNSAEAEYTLTVSYMDISDTPYTLEGKSNNDSGWYSGHVRIIAKEGYQISYSNDLDNNVWSNYVDYKAEGINSARVYFRNIDTGGISDVYITEQIKYDSLKPSDLKIVYSSPFFEIISRFFYKIFKEIEVTLEAKDFNSGIESITYTCIYENGSSFSDSIPKSQFKTSDNYKTVKASFTIKKKFRGKITFKVMDVAGNVAYYELSEDNRIVIVDTTPPVVTITYNTPKTMVDINEETVTDVNSDTVLVYDKTINAEIKIDEDNFFEGAKTEDKSYVNNVHIKVTKTSLDGKISEIYYVPYKVSKPGYEEITWTNDGKYNIANIYLTDDGDYTISIDYEDHAGLEMEYTSDLENKTGTREYTSNTLRIDKTKPEMWIDVDSNITNQDLPVVFNVKEHNFNVEDLHIDIKATDIEGNILESVDTASLTAYLKEKSNWIKEKKQDCFSAQLVFTDSANYHICISYTDKAGNIGDDYYNHITVDKQIPNLGTFSVSYSQAVLEAIINTITFGYYKSNVRVTLQAQDEISKINSFEYIYTVEPGASNINTGLNQSVIISEKDIIYKDSGKTACASFDIEPQFRGNVAFRVTDSAGNKSIYYNDEKILVIDSISPERRVFMNPIHIIDADTLQTKHSNEEDENLKLFFKEEAVIYLEIKEANFYPEDVVIHVLKDGKESIDVLPDAWIKNGDIYTSSVTITGEGEYIFTMEYEDRSSNKMKTYKSGTIIIDNTPPEIYVQPMGMPVQTIEGIDYYDNILSVRVIVKEKNFRAEDITAIVTAETVDGLSIEVEDYNNYLRDISNWENKDDIYTITIPVNVDARYSIDFNYMDLAKNNAIKSDAKRFVVDTTKPENTSVSYSTSVVESIIETVTFGFYSSPVVVTLQADDNVAGIHSFEYKAEKSSETDSSNTLTGEELSGIININDIEFTNNGKTATGRFEISPQYRGYITFTAKDTSGNLIEHEEDKVIVTDNIAPNATISFSKPKAYIDSENNLVSNITDKTILLYSGAINVDIAIKEANFFEGQSGDDNAIIQDVRVVVTKKGINGISSEIEYVPYETTQTSKERITWSHDNDLHRTSIQLKDDGDYIISVTYKDKSGNEMVYSSDYGGNGTYTYTSNILRIDTTAPIVKIDVPKVISNSDMIISFSVIERNFNPEDISIGISATDIEGNTLSYVDTSSLVSSVRAKSGWTQSGDTWTKTVTFNQSANYTISMSCTDKAGNVSKVVDAKFTIDKEGPSLENLKITYSNPVLSKIINSITFGYYQKPVVVTLEATDIISGIASFEYQYTLSKNVSEINKGLDAPIVVFEDKITKPSKKTAFVSFEIPPQFVGNVSFRTSDIAGNHSPMFYDDDVIVVDSITPERTVTMHPVHIVDSVTLETRHEYMEKSGSKLFFSDDAVLTIKINEANFYQEDVVIKVSKDKGEFIKVDPDQWTQNKDEWTTTLTLTGDGDYVVTIDYKDRSGNIMNAFTSDTIVIDTIKPIIHTEIIDTPINTIEGVQYYNIVQTMSVSITEHNFRPQDVTVDIIAETIDGLKVNTQDYNQYLRNEENWVKKGDTYTALLTFNKDANYSFDISYKDLAFNEAKDFKSIKFTVDTQVPTNLNINYSTSILDTILNTISFGFYNAKAEVTITAQDNTGGINYFTYSYSNEHGNSLTEEKIWRDNITYKDDGKVAVASFTLPSNSVDNNGQFRGTMSFTAYDSSGNKTQYEDGKVTVVDSISPNMEVYYNQPVQMKDDVYYYSGDVEVSFHVTENNFYPEDFNITVTKNDNQIIEIKPSWNNTANIWTGSFQLSANDPAMDGEYVITAEYTDKSGNSMEPYKSQNIIIDTEKPEIYISGVEDHSAYKKDTIGFQLKVKDKNLDKFEPILYGTFIDEDYGIIEEKLDLGEVITVKEGEELIYNIENLERDGVYKITCVANDLSGNLCSTMYSVKDTLSTELEEKDEIVFSVNRNGSTFMLSTHTVDMINNFYVNEVKDNIQISEINVDPLEKIDILLNDIQLNEGMDYVLKEDSYEGKWYRYNYSINRGLFAKEGSYSIVIKTMDKAGSISYSDIKKAEISFVVDKTKPELVISGIKNDGRYRDHIRTATLIPKDPGGELDQLKITINNGQKVIDMHSDNLNDSLMESGGVIKFDIPSGMGHFVEILCVDKAGNQSQLNFNNITVSTDWYVLFYANKRLFWGTISTTLAILVGSMSFAFFRKKRRLKKSK